LVPLDLLASQEVSHPYSSVRMVKSNSISPVGQLPPPEGGVGVGGVGVGAGGVGVGGGRVGVGGGGVGVGGGGFGGVGVPPAQKSALMFH